MPTDLLGRFLLVPHRERSLDRRRRGLTDRDLRPGFLGRVGRRYAADRGVNREIDVRRLEAPQRAA